MTLAQFSGVIMDMDGVLWRGEERLPGVVDWFAFLRQHQVPVALATNNATKSPEDYLEKFARMGIEGLVAQQIVTSGTTTADYLARHYPPGTTVYVVGSERLRAMISAAGCVVTDPADVVVVGLDPQLSYERLKRAALLIRGGATFIGTNPDRTYPMPEGLTPGAGSVIAAVVAATDQQPLLMGKPHAPMYESALRILGTRPEQTLMIGDRLDTDIAGAKALGMQTALVMTGVATPADVESAVGDARPDAVYADLLALLRDVP